VEVKSLVDNPNNSEVRRPRRAPATTDADREARLVAAAYDLAERQMYEGRLPATVHAQLLRAGSQRERLEQKKLAMEVELRRAQVDQIESQRSSEELYAKAMNAMKRYSGQEVEDEVF